MTVDAERIARATGLDIIVAAAESADPTLARVGQAACSLVAVERGVAACFRGEGYVEGRRGRGSRRRYRAVVIEAIERWSRAIHRYCPRTGRELSVDERTTALRRSSNAARRARRILVAVDAAIAAGGAR